MLRAVSVWPSTTTHTHERRQTNKKFRWLVSWCDHDTMSARAVSSLLSAPVVPTDVSLSFSFKSLRQRSLRQRGSRCQGFHPEQLASRRGSGAVYSSAASATALATMASSFFCRCKKMWTEDGKVGKQRQHTIVSVACRRGCRRDRKLESGR